MEILHFSHDHPLNFKDVQKNEGTDVLCYGCKKPILDHAYCCRECDYFLHKSCAELNREIKDPIHPEHLLTLDAGSSSYICDACKQGWDRFIYCCYQCDFGICMPCWLEERMIKLEIHQHPLSVLLRPSLFFCDICSIEDKGTSYVCHSCQFWIHKSCASLPNTIKINDHHHPLTLTKQYFVHVKCTTSKARSSRDAEINSSNKDDELLESNLVSLPVNDEFVDLVRHFVKDINVNKFEKETKINDWSHQHPLLLFDVQNINEVKDDKILCNACVQPISLPFYGCRQCNYFMHLGCAHLPDEVQHPSHPEHLLKLGRFTSIYSLITCDCCNMNSNGLFYWCKTCKFYVDVKCAFLPSTIKHESHKHPLVLGEGSHSVCKSCGYKSSTFIFRCDTCNFNLDYNCALLSKNVKHRWDQHPFILTYRPPNDHPDEFHCEFCEEEINPQYWMYYCHHCDQSLYARCIYDNWSKTKFGGTVQVDHHSHPLTFVRKMKEFACCRCGPNALMAIVAVKKAKAIRKSNKREHKSSAPAT
ncbi:unnamed protein product [Ilex paraguariensis]|uniref:DC1 domain-containing protein n=1 Tax=Ilex paraguariensis TaxID=185542 RepID=A0ABC8UCR9_9AQUA